MKLYFIIYQIYNVCTQKTQRPSFNSHIKGEFGLCFYPSLLINQRAIFQICRRNFFLFSIIILAEYPRLAITLLRHNVQATGSVARIEIFRIDEG